MADVNPFLPASPDTSSTSDNPFIPKRVEQNPFLPSKPSDGTFSSKPRVEKPKPPKAGQFDAPAVLPTISGALEVPYDALDATYRDAVNADPLNKTPLRYLPIPPVAGLVKNAFSLPSEAEYRAGKRASSPEYDKFAGLLRSGKLQEAADEYGFGAPSELEYESRAGDPVSGFRTKHPLINAGLTLATEFKNPTNPVFAKAIDIVARPAITAARAIIPGVDPAMRLASMAASKAAQKAGDALGATFDAYHGIRKAGGPEYEAAARRKAAAMANAESEIRKRTDAIFAGLTRAQKIEAARRSAIDLETRQPKSVDPSIPEPKDGPSLDQRAMMMRGDIMKDSAALRARKALVDESIPDEQYFDMRDYGQKRYVRQDELDPENQNTEFVPLSLAAKVRPGFAGARTGNRIIGNYSRQMKYKPGIEDIDVAELHPEFDPAEQYAQMRRARLRTIAGIDSQNALNNVRGTRPIKPDDVNPPTPHYPTRIPLGSTLRTLIQFRDPITQSPLGTGEQAYDTAYNVLDRKLKADSLGQALNELVAEGKADPNILNRRVQAVSYLRGRVGGAIQRAKDAERAAQAAGATLKNVEANGAVTDAQNRITKAAGRALGVASDLRAGADQARDVNEVLRANVAGHGEKAKMQAADLDRLREELKAAPAAVRGIADEFYQAQSRAEKPVWDAIRQYGGKIEMDMIQGPGGKWRPAGEMADLPKGLLKRPGILDPNAVRHNGNLDQIADAAGMTPQELKDFLAQHPRPTSMNDALKYAREQYSTAAARDAVKQQVGAIRDTRKSAQVAKARSAGARDVAAVANPVAKRAAREADRIANGDLEGIAQRVDTAQKRAVARVQRNVDRANDEALTARLELNELGERWVNGKADRAMKDAVYARRDQILREKLKRKSVADRVADEAAIIPKGYAHEQALALGIPDSKYYALDAEFAKWLTLNHGTGVPADDDANAFWKALSSLNRLSRLGIILIPTTHALFNLGSHYLAAGGDADGFADVMTGAGLRGRNKAFIERARTAGALPDFHQGTFGGGDREVHIMTTAPRELLNEHGTGLLGRARGAINVADQFVTKHFWEPSQALVFDHFDTGYAVDLFRRYVEGGMTDGDAARAVRQALGDYTNITEREARFNLTRIFNFYPWAKTLLKFWASKGLADAKTWNAPLRGVEVNNQQQGYDDPSKPFTMTVGKTGNGEFRRYALPLPQRVLENIGDVGAAAADIPRGLGQSWRDLRGPADYVTGHLTSLGQLGYEGLLNATGKAAPYQQFSDPKADPMTQIAQAIGHVTGRIVSPAEAAQRIINDPSGGVVSLLLGGVSSATKTQMQQLTAKIVRDAYNAAIRQANAVGDSATAQRLYAQMKADRRI